MVSFEKHQKRQSSILQYTPPKLYIGKEWYVGFYAYDPAVDKLRRKKIKINFIEKISDRRKYANGLILRLNDKLMNGWNPWIEAENSKSFHTIKDVFDHYRRFIEKMYLDNLYREDTYVSYISYLRNLENYINGIQRPLNYIYQFDRAIVLSFLEYIYIERKNTPQTRDNYLTFLRVLSTWLVQNQYLKTKPTEGVVMFGKRSKRKQRTIISDADIVRLHDFLMTKNKHYLLACYMIYYCFIRPKELSKIKLEHLSIAKQTLYIPDENSKNRKDGTVTLPKKVVELMIELDIFSHPNEYYLFSDNFEPGKEPKSEKTFRDFWLRVVRKELKFPANYKFYSLKDTGITSMLKQFPSIMVRDQARHSTITMTDTYTPHDLQEANEYIKNHDGIF
jgi:integrase